VKLVLGLLFTLLATGCKGPKSTSTSVPRAWHAAYFEQSSNAGRTFHSELQLAPGQKAELKIPAEDAIIIGFTLEKGYEVYHSKKWVWLGTPEKPHKVSGAPGIADKFVPTNGMITLIVENESPIDTRVAIFTGPVGKN
jgi:hypothetical protein